MQIKSQCKKKWTESCDRMITSTFYKEREKKKGKKYYIALERSLCDLG